MKRFFRPLRRSTSAIFLITLLFATPMTDARADDTFLLTVFLKHDQSKTIDQIGQDLSKTGFWAKFPPEGVAVESWYVMMGIGQVVTLRVPASRLRDVNLAIEKTAWGAFRTEFYPTYDLRPVVKKLKDKAKKTRR